MGPLGFEPRTATLRQVSSIPLRYGPTLLHCALSPFGLTTEGAYPFKRGSILPQTILPKRVIATKSTSFFCTRR